MAARRRLKKVDKAFDDISTISGVPNTSMSWSKAFEAMQAGKHVRREGWVKIVLWIGIKKDQFDKPHVTMCCYDRITGGERRTKWCPYYTDFEAFDWQEV